ncbi:hypothetical protein GCM10023169_14610 [Georgenia halophila]|uniref:Uncharacterized protein n=1 Tax=Georgenia halophila TaxID=620889 RepID=A0ABP8L2P9_9MICO
MKDIVGNVVRRIAPRTMQNLETINRWDAEYEDHGPRILMYERELREMRREIDAMRREQRRVTELYDAVFEHARRSGTAGEEPEPEPEHKADR